MSDVMTNNENGNYEKAVRELSMAYAEPSWLTEMRLEALDLFNATPMPTKRDDAWRYTDLRKIVFDGYTLPTASALPCTEPAKVKALEGFEEIADHGAVMIHCESAPTTLNIPASWKERGATVHTWRDAANARDDSMRDIFQSGLTKKFNDRFSMLHNAFANSATVIHIPANVQLDEPMFNILWYCSDNKLQAPKLVVYLESGAKVSVVDIIGGSGKNNLIIPSYNFTLSSNSTLRYIRLQQSNLTTTMFGYQYATLGRDSQATTAVVNLGGKLVRDVIESKMVDSGAYAKMLGLYVPGGDQHFDHVTLQDHIASRCSSDLLFKGALSGRARAVFSGKINVHKGAQKTDAYQKNRSILLSKESRADSVPQLEINADDVRCSHGATVSRVQESDVFYLMSRGLTREQSEETLVFGFLDEVINKLDWADMTVPLECRISSRIKFW